MAVKYQSEQQENQLVECIGKCFDNPLTFVRFNFTWGEGELAGEEGPDTWQIDVLDKLGRGVQTLDEAVKLAVASGHGVGKSCIVAWVIIWFLSTRPHANMVITANTKTQLETKTWRELAKWWKLSLNKHWFNWTATKFYHIDHPETWFAANVPWSKERSEAFAGTHATHVAMIFDEACHDSQTEVLTEDGWKYFKDIKLEDKLLTRNKETGISEYVNPTRIFASHYNGKMYLSERRGCNFCVTPNHKMYTQFYSVTPNQKYSSWRFQRISEMNGVNYRFLRHIEWEGKEDSYFILPQYETKAKFYPSMKIDMDKWLYFLGWYFSEGSLLKKKNKNCFNYFGITISQKDVNVLEKIKDVINSIGFKANLHITPTCPQLHIINRQLGEYLSQFGLNCLEKFLPQFISKLSKRQINIFLDEYIKGDWYKHSKSEIIYTSSKKMADDLQILCLKSGSHSTVHKRKIEGQVKYIIDHYAKSSKDGYVIRKSPNNEHIGYLHKHTKEIDYNGNVYCAEVNPHHLLFTRRNGTCLWSGNSNIEDIIWEVGEGAMTTPGSIWLVFGNPTRNVGRFYDCFHKYSHRWITYQVDSRVAKKTNKAQLQQWIEDYGIDSDFVKVRIKGQFPKQAVEQFIPVHVVDEAIKRNYMVRRDVWDWAPIVIGVDVARFGDDKSVIWVRQGLFTHKISKYTSVNVMSLAGYVAEHIISYKPKTVFVDVVGIGAGVVDRLRMLGHKNIIEVNVGEKASNERNYANKRAEVYSDMKKWLVDGGSIPSDDELKEQLIALEYWFDNKSKLCLESKRDMKARGLPSPDLVDALAMTFAIPMRVADKVLLSEVDRRIDRIERGNKSPGTIETMMIDKAMSDMAWGINEPDASYGYAVYDRPYHQNDLLQTTI